MNNRGISAVVATVLIILITVAAISIIWIAVLPVMKENLKAVSANQIDLTILKKGYTVYDVDKKVASVQIKRGADDENLEKLKVTFYINGSSESVVFDDAPLSNSALVYLFNFSRLEWGIPSEVSVSPILRIGNDVVEGDLTHKTKIEVRKMNLGELENGLLGDKGSSSGNGDSGELECSDGKESFNGLCYTPLIGCASITESGRYYLKNDVESEGTCFEIEAGDVVLDGNGKGIEGAGAQGAGVYVEGVDGIIIEHFKNISGFEKGIYLNQTNNSVIQNLVVLDSGKEGIYFWRSSNNQLKNLLVNSNNGEGIFFSKSSYNLLKNISANLNHWSGIRFEFNQNNTLQDITTNSNGFIGLALAWRSHNNVVTGVISNSNKWEGIALSGSKNNTLKNISANSNQRIGIVFYDSSDNNSLIDSEFCNNDLIESNKEDRYDFSCGRHFQSPGQRNSGQGNVIGSVEINCSNGWPFEQDYDSC